MKLEDRYIVLKRKDVEQLSVSMQETLEYICHEVGEVRRFRGAEPLDGVFIEKDWPEHDEAKEMLVNRICNE